MKYIGTAVLLAFYIATKLWIVRYSFLNKYVRTKCPNIILSFISLLQAFCSDCTTSRKIYLVDWCLLSKCRTGGICNVAIRMFMSSLQNRNCVSYTSDGNLLFQLELVTLLTPLVRNIVNKKPFHIQTITPVLQNVEHMAWLFRLG